MMVDPLLFIFISTSTTVPHGVVISLPRYCMIQIVLLYVGSGFLPLTLVVVPPG